MIFFFLKYTSFGDKACKQRGEIYISRVHRLPMLGRQLYWNTISEAVNRRRAVAYKYKSA